MKNISTVIFEIIVSVLFVLMGLSDKKFLFIHDARSAAISLSIIGMLLCTISVGKFISAAPAHPLTILGYIFGTIAMLSFITQLFKLNLPIINEPKTALVVIAAAIAMNSIIARFYDLLSK